MFFPIFSYFFHIFSYFFVFSDPQVVFPIFSYFPYDYRIFCVKFVGGSDWFLFSLYFFRIFSLFFFLFFRIFPYFFLFFRIFRSAGRISNSYLFCI